MQTAELVTAPDVDRRPRWRTQASRCRNRAATSGSGESSTTPKLAAVRRNDAGQLGGSARRFATQIRVAIVTIAGVYAVACPTLGLSMSPGVGRQSVTIAVAAVLIAFASASFGALFGFIFAIPRELQSINPGADSASSRYIANTNLEQISDWLTKVIVGVSLVQIGKLPAALDDLDHRLAPLLGSSPASGDVGVVLAITAVITAFLLSYLYTRVIITWLFAATGRDIDDYSKRATTEAAVKTAQAAVEEKVKKVVGEQVSGDQQVVDNIMESVRSEVAKSVVTVEFNYFDRVLSPVSVPLTDQTTVFELLNFIFGALPNSVTPYTYGEEWLLRRSSDGVVFRDIGTKWARGMGRPTDDRLLTDPAIGIAAGDTLEVIDGPTPQSRKA